MKKPVDIVEMRVPAKPEYVGIIRLTSSGVSSRMGFSYEDIEDIKIAVSEASTNAIQHGYKGEEGEVTIGFGVYEDRLEIIVADNGESFNSDEVRKKTGPYHSGEKTEDLREGGLGLFLIDTLMDRLEINHDSGVIVIMTKYLGRDEVERRGDTISTSQTK
ncbi:anti-sigma B factor RsbW [Bacillus solimangrovi]|uniref:Serine-protein kinase RsbW n=1 Tax=Bacillus solimangrovi TaxID=1305675 RepID=A0A1E5LG72_9BACI|nr:anti-sigma B factor RsbW [Bacillus solimangrovi]OEH93073.1 anti-sigma B factor RsbW [Bacillus solimangrovi]